MLDGTVARRSNKSSTFGAFLDSTLDRVADGAILSGLAVFYALNPVHRNVPMVVVCLTGLIGSFLTSYIRARAEALGLDAKVGMVQRPERFVLLSVPQAFFGLALDGWVLGTHHRISHGHCLDHRRAAHATSCIGRPPRAAMLRRLRFPPKRPSGCVAGVEDRDAPLVLERRLIRGFVHPHHSPRERKAWHSHPGAWRCCNDVHGRRGEHSPRPLASRSARSRRWRRFASASAPRIGRR